MSKSEAYSQATWSYGMPMYWHEKQVVVAFQSEVPYSTTSTKKGVAAAIKSLNLDWLGSFLTVRGLQLKPFTQEQVARPVRAHEHDRDHDRDEDANDPDAKHAKVEGDAYGKNGHHGEQSGEYGATRELNSPIGKFLFPSPIGNRTTVISFFNVDVFDTGYPLQDESEGGYGTTSSVTRRAVNLLNSNLAMIRDEGKVPVTAAGPNWLGGGSGLGCTTTGGPADPPCPVFDTNACSSSNGFWPITIPAVENSQLTRYTGEGVTVFVLDTMPGIVNPPGVQTPSHVLSANGEATTLNGLLETVTGQMNAASTPYIKIHYQDLPPMNDGNFLLGTGRDINGKPYGYLMPDHGLFVTGIVRDVAPGATIEFVRVLDDYGVGSTDTLISALNAIQTRIVSGDLKGQPVVVNLSLLISPPDSELPMLWFGNNATFSANQVYRANYDLTLLNAPLHDVIKSLIGAGAVVIAAAGNESNTSDIPRRLGPAYPAAYPEVIAVGAVDSKGAAATYSNYPQSPTQPNGIATYGGALLPPDALTNHDDIDAVRGLYSSESYPQLDSQNTGSVPQPPDRDTHWAYWSGTSFATPIISAVAARALQLKAGGIPANLWANEMQHLLTTAQGQQELFGHALAPQPDLGVSLLVAQQGCQPANAHPVAVTPQHETSSIG